VIEHVAPAQCERFVTEVAQLLTPAGSAIVTSDRGELHSRWLRREHTTEQPEENWFTESQLRALFEGAGFVVAERDRAYFEVPELSLFHRVVAPAQSPPPGVASARAPVPGCELSGLALQAGVRDVSG
jgi:hypothetical protein